MGKSPQHFSEMCHERGIIVSLELFDRFDLFRAEAENESAAYAGNRNTGWLHHPWNPDRNINYTPESPDCRREALMIWDMIMNFIIQFRN
jgi:hypothetical protein